MLKKLGIVCIALISTFSVVLAMDAKLNANTLDSMSRGGVATGSVTWNQYAKVNVSGSDYIALSNNGKFLATQNTTTNVTHDTELPTISNTRKPSLINDTSYASKADIEGMIDASGILNAKIPTQPTWWLKDTLVTNKIASARIVGSDNSTNALSYTDIINNQWFGNLPTESKTNITGKTSWIKYLGATSQIVSGEVGYNIAGNTTVYGCRVMYADGKFWECNTFKDENGNVHNPFTSLTNSGANYNLGYVDEKALIEDKVVKVTAPPEGVFSLGANHVVCVSLDQTGGAAGCNLMMTSQQEVDMKGNAAATWKVRNVMDLTANSSMPSEANPYPAGCRACISNYDGGFNGDGLNGAGYISETKPQNEIGTAAQRPTIALTASDIAHGIEASGSVGTIIDEEFVTTLKADTSYKLSLWDSTLAISSIAESDGSNKIDATNKKIELEQGKTTIKFALECNSAIVSGDTRYISAVAKDKDGNVKYKKVLQVPAVGMSQVSIDITNLLDNQKINETATINLYVEDVSADGTAYMSQAYPVDVTVVLPYELKFANPDSPSNFLATNEYAMTFDPAVSAANQFTLVATDQTTANKLNSKVEYCILDESKVCATTNPYIEFVSGAAAGAQKINVKKTGETDQIIYVRAMTKTTLGDIDISNDIAITLHPAKQAITWKGTDIAVTGNHIIQKADSTDTWLLNMRYSGNDIDTYEIDTLLKDQNSTAGKLAVQSTAITGTPSLHFELQYTKPTDSSKIYMEANKLCVAGATSGSVKLKVIGNSFDNYEVSAPIYLELGIKPTISLEYDAEYVGNIDSTLDFVNANAKLGTLRVNPSETGFTYKINKITSNDITLTETFVIDSGTGVLSVGNSSLNIGEYNITIKASKGTDIVTSTIKIRVVAASFDISNWKWQKEVAGVYENVSGSIDDSRVNTDKVIETYEANKTLKVRLDGIPKDASVAYAVDGSSIGVIEVTDKGTYALLTIKTGSPDAADVKVKATIRDASGSFGDEDIWLPIQIDKYPQKIKFKDSNVLYLPNNAPCVKVQVEKDSTNWNSSSAHPVVLSTTSKAFIIQGDTICPVAKASGTNEILAANLGGDLNFAASPEITKKITIYEPGSISVTKSIEVVENASSNVTYTPGEFVEALNETEIEGNQQGTATKDTIVANVKLNGIAAATSNAYTPSTISGGENADIALFKVGATGNISLNQDISASDILNHGSHTYKIQVNVKDIHGYSQTVNVHIRINEANPDFYFIDGEGQALTLNDMYIDGTTSIAKYTQTYSKNGTFDVNVNMSGDVHFKVDTQDGNQATDVLIQSEDQNDSNQFTTTHATELDTSGAPVKKAYIEACVNAQYGYQAKCIYSVVQVNKGKQNLKFALNPLALSKNSGTITPIYMGHLDSKPVLISNSSNPGLVSADPFVEGQTSDQSIHTSENTGSATITATAQGDRDYDSTQATTIVNITDRPASTLTLQASPSSNMTYGEANGSVRILTGYNASNAVYFWSENPDIIEVNDENVNDDTSSLLQINKVGIATINVCQSDDPNYIVGDACPANADYGFIQVEVQKADITLSYNDVEIYTGEALPPISINPKLTSGTLFGSDTIEDFPVPASVNYKDNTSILTDTSHTGTYKIIGTYSTEESAQSIVENYNVTFVDGNLDIKQDDSAATWYHLESVSTGTTLDANVWHKDDVSVVLDPANASAGLYDEISLDKITWDTNAIAMSNEDENNVNLYFRINTNSPTHPLTIATPQLATVKIDKTKPVVKNITGTLTNKDAISQLINKLTFGVFFKPGTKVNIQSEDVLPFADRKVSGVKETMYRVYEIDKKTGLISATPIKEGTIMADATGKSEITLDDIGLYRVCAISKDHAGNESIEICSDINIKKIDVDIDGDNENEFQDPGNDGCPDINIPLQDKEGKIYKVNVDTDDNHIPDLNIDSDGNGIAEINVDTDDDGKPDVNLVNLSKWEPTFCTTVKSEYAAGSTTEYCTMKDIKPIINIDLDNNGIPEIDIDNIGDFKPHLNISKDGKKASLNIVKLHDWTPNENYKNDEFHYDSIKDEAPYKAELNIDTSGDGLPDVSIDFNNDGKADLNIDTNGDSIPDIEIDVDGDGEADINFDTNDDGQPDKDVVLIKTWKPDSKGDKDGFAYDTMGSLKGSSELEDNGVKVEKPGGNFLPNYSIKVSDISNSIEDSVKEEIEKMAKDQEIKSIYDVSLWKDDVVTQPDGSIRVKIPYDSTIKNPKVLVEQSNGSFKEADAKLENGYLVYETDFLGKIGIVGDQEIDKDTSDDDDTTDVNKPDTTPSGNGGNTSSGNTSSGNTSGSSVKGNYTPGTGGAGTGIGNEQRVYACIFMVSALVIGLQRCQMKKKR